MSKKPYTIKSLINELSKYDPDAPVIVAYWTPDLFDLTNEQFQEVLEENNIDEVDVSDASEDIYRAVQYYKEEHGLEDN